MNFAKNSQFITERPAIQMTPLMDMVFLVTIFFMSAFVFYELETEMSISVPEAKESTPIKRMPGEIIINIRKDGTIIVNQRELTLGELGNMLSKVSALYKGQPVIIRGDKETYHKNIIKVLDVCAEANIWNVSFATMKEEKK